MAGLVVTIDLRELEEIADRIASLGDPAKRTRLLKIVGRLHTGQVQERIDTEKTAPDGSQWPDWSDDYADTRGEGKSLLEDEGDLLTSIHERLINQNTIAVGSSLIYAATHNEGDPDRNIPARKYLGLSDENQDEMEIVIIDWLDRQLAA